MVFRPKKNKKLWYTFGTHIISFVTHILYRFDIILKKSKFFKKLKNAVLGAKMTLLILQNFPLIQAKAFVTVLSHFST